MPPDTTADHQPADPGRICYWCHAVLREDGTCPECGRRQTRICFCGQELYPGEDPCPYCGADGTGVLKVRRRRRRKRVVGAEAIRYAAAGVFGAVLIGAVLTALVDRLALSSADSRELPSSLADRWGLAATTIHRFAGSLAATLDQRLGMLLPLLVLGILGGLIGLLIYLYHTRAGPALRDHPDALPEPGRRRRV